MSIKKLHFSLLAFLIGFFANAQIFPVQVNSNIVPPYLPSVSSYATSTNQKYFVNIFTADLSVVNRPATLKFYIEGNGIQAQSTPVVTGAAPIYLNGGETISLTNIDLAPYFQIQNLQGISPAQYANNLPQGQYNYCIEVYDAFTNQKISQKSCTFYYFLYNEPPLLNLPNNHEVQFFRDPQNFIFTWTPRHINATNIEYEFALVELIDNVAPSNYAFAVGAPLYQTTTNNTILLYGPTEPQMIAGRKYAWRVKAVNQPGFGEDALFNNNGYSEIYDFVYAGNCVAPTFVVSFSLSSTQAKITWQPNPDHLGYKVEYRKLNTTNWFEAANFNNEAKLFDLEPSATYEFRVGAMCIGNQITYSPINQFTQPAGNVVTLNCGLMPTVDLSNQVLYTATMPSDQVFLAGDFPIHVTEVSGTTTYTGKGWTNLPYFSFVRIQVEFKDIKVNTGMSLVDGVIKATYDPTWSNIIDINAVVGVIENAGDAFSPDTDEHSYQVDFVIPNASSIVVTDNSIVINGPAGQVITHDRDLGESVIIRDANGNVYGVGPTANSAVLLQAGAGFIPSSSNTTGVNSSGQVTAFDHTKAKVTFKRSPNGANGSKFADDERPLDNTISPKILSKYKKVNDYNYYYKGVENDGKATRSTEFIEARIETFDNTIVADSIVFNIKGSKANKIGNAIKNGNISTVTLEVPVFETVKELELLALIKKSTATGKNTVVGAAMIIPTKILPVVNVTIVPVNGATIPTNINTSLQDIYKGVGVTFNTTVAPNYISTITTLQCGDSGFMANYTAEQNTFIGKYTALHPADAKQYYVFVMNNITPSRSINGFMPLHRQMGFIFPSQTSQTATSEIKTGNDITSTIAHELGHGIFELEHPWEDFNYPKTTPATNWLMDYAQGTKLPYTHWQKMSHPKFGLYIFQSDASGEMSPQCESKLSLISNFVNQNVNYLKILAAESGVNGTELSNGQTFPTSIYSEGNGSILKITHYKHWSNTNPVAYLFLVETNNPILKANNIKYFWLSYIPNNIDGWASTINVKLHLKDLKPEPNEPSFCVRDIEMPRGVSAGAALSNLIGNTVLIGSVAIPTVCVLAEGYTAYVATEFLTKYLAERDAACLKNIALDVGFQVFINSIVKSCNGVGIPFSYASTTLACASAYITPNNTSSEACAIGALTSLGDSVINNMRTGNTQSVTSTMSQAAIACVITATFHHFATTSYISAIKQSVQWYYIKNLITKNLSFIQKPIVGKLMVDYENRILSSTLAKIINNSASNETIKSNLIQLEQYLKNSKNIVEEGNEILIKDVDNKIIAKFENGEFKVVQGAGNLFSKLDNLGLTALKTEINLLDDVAKVKFLDEFAGASDDALRALNSEKDLVGIWRNISHLKSEANSVTFLQWVKKAKNSHLPIHLKGEVNQLNNAVGCHLQSAVDGSRVKILPTPPPVYNGSELVRAKIEIEGITKNALSTFFPKSWDEARVLEEVALIIKNSSNQVGANIRKFQGLASDGVTKIEIRLSGPDNNLNFDTVFPY